MKSKQLINQCIALGLTAVLGAGSTLPVMAAKDQAKPATEAKAALSMIAHYPLQENAEDISGNDKDAQVTGSVAWQDGLALPGGKKTSASDASYVTLPEGMFDGKDDVTISVWIKSNTNKGNYSALFFGTAPQSNQMPLNYWLFNPTNPAGLFKSVFTNDNNAGAPYNSEVGVTSVNTEGYKGVWTHYTTVLTEDSVTGYVNGEKVGTAPKTKKTSDFGKNLQAYIGRSNYVEDNTYAGSFQDLRIYDGAVSDEDAEEIFLNTESVNANVKAKVLGSIAEKLSLEELLDYGMAGKAGDMNLPGEIYGAKVTWSSDHKDIISDDGVVTLPDAMTDVTLTANIKLGDASRTRQFKVTVMAKDGQLDYWMDKLSVPYVLDSCSALPTSLGNVEISWGQADCVETDGLVNPDFTGKKQIVLEATLREGNQQKTKEFQVYVMGSDAVYTQTYTRTPDADYTVNLAYSMHLAYSEDGKTDFVTLNDNSGILYMRAADNPDETMTRKSMKNPYLFYRKDGGFGVIATRVEVGGGTDGQKASSVMLYTSEDLLSYQEVGFLDMKTNLTVQNPVCEYDTANEVYRITWNDGNGNYYQNTLDRLSPDAAISQPEKAAAPEVRKAETKIAGAADGNLIPLENSIGTKLKTKLSKLYNTGVEVPEKIRVTEKEEVENTRATAYYNDGSTVSKNVNWDLSGVDFNAPGTYTVNGTATQLTFHNENYLFHKRPDPEMVKFKDKFYFISTDEDGQSRLFIRKSDTLAEIGSSQESLIMSGSSYTDLFTACLWAPELHVIEEDLYLFFSGSLGGWDGVQSFVAKLKDGGDPTKASDWEKPVRVVDKNGVNIYDASVGITLDMTYFEVSGQGYVAWAQRQRNPVDNGSWLYIATVDKSQPWKLTSDRICISKPDYGWDNNDTFVDEGPFVIQRDGNIFMTFSGGNVNPTYCVGILSAKEGDNLLDASVWKKGNYPILTSRSVPGQYGPGHNSYIYDDDGTLYNVYHAQWNKGARSAGIRRVHFDIDGMPVLDLVEERDLLDEYKNVTMQVEVYDPKEQVTVTYEAGEGGRIEGAAIQTITKGSDAGTVTAVAGEGYTFVRWSDGTASASRTDKNVTESRTYTAIFEKTAVPEENNKTEVPKTQKVTLNEKSVVMGQKEKVTLKAKVLPAGESGKINWKSDKKSIVTVNKKGVLTAKKPGKATITATAANGAAATCKVTVRKAPGKISLKAKAKTLRKGKTYQIKVKFPAKTASYKLTYKSGKKAVAAVSPKGKVTARKKGAAVITVKTFNGKTAKMKIRVK